MKRLEFKPILRRLLICIAISSVAVLIFSEIAFLFQSDGVNRGPDTIELVIPSGTSELVSAGMAPPGIPDSMTFVTGDELVVVNQDEVDHQLGPVWVPPGGTASLQLGEVEHIAFACSFQPTRYLGIRVEEPTTIFTRLLALAIAVPPTAAMLLVYSLAAYPLDGDDKQQTEPNQQSRVLTEPPPYVEPTRGKRSTDKVS